MKEAEYKAVITNLKNYNDWDYKKYPLSEKEAIIIINALKKCVSTRPIFKEMGLGKGVEAECPNENCSGFIPKIDIDRRVGYCRWCGQKLTWPDPDEADSIIDMLFSNKEEK